MSHVGVYTYHEQAGALPRFCPEAARPGLLSMLELLQHNLVFEPLQSLLANAFDFFQIIDTFEGTILLAIRHQGFGFHRANTFQLR